MVGVVAGSSLAVQCAEDAGKLTWWEVGGGKEVKGGVGGEEKDDLGVTSR